MNTYFDIVDRKWRIRLENGDVADSKFSSEEDAYAAIDLAFDHSMMLLQTERGYRKASERGAKRREAEGI